MLETFHRIFGSCSGRFIILFCLLLSLTGCSRTSSHKNSTPLSRVVEAATNGDAAQVASILASHPDLASRHLKHGVTLLHLSAYQWTNGVTAAIIKAGADVNAMDSNGRTPLNAAMYGKRTSTVELLLNSGASPNKTSPGRPSPLFSAVLGRDYAVVKLLVDHGADVNYAHNGMSILRNATLDNRHPKIAAYLKAHGAKVRPDERY